MTKVEDLLEKRKKLRKEKKFEEADLVRKQIEEMGYQVIDEDESSTVEKIEDKPSGKSFLVLFGSGEILPQGRRIHEYVFEQIGKNQINIAVISTPAGFQPNCVIVHEEIKSYFEKHLTNFHPKVSIIYANNRELANNEKIIEPIFDADYIFIGPGSPTYAVRNLKDTLLLKKLFECIRSGATLSLASAAAIAFSKHALPVYEIYKAGTDLYWEEGLNFFRDVFEEITVVPHYDNTEGGKKNDTSRAYIGKIRFERMLKILPEGEKLLGIDEQTGFIFDLKNKTSKVLGRGEVRELTV